jgi:N-acetylglutamate synthase-like GNAT family acetyltransferase
MKISYKTDTIPTVDQVIELYENAGLPRPTQDRERMSLMYENSNLIVTVWNGDQLIGVSRCITDWVWSCYLADLAVHNDFQKLGIGKRLVEITQEKVGDQTMILLLSVPTAMDYYPKIGFDKENRSFAIPRKK